MTFADEDADSILANCDVVADADDVGFGAASEKSEHTRLENMILGQLKIGEHRAKWENME